MSFLPVPSDDELSPEARAAAEELALGGADGRLTAFDRAHLAEKAVFDGYAAWYGLRDEVAPYLGERAVELFCYALASALGAPLLVARFRVVLEAGGDDPDAPQVTAAEQLLIDWARSIGTQPAAVPEELVARVEETFQPRLRVLLTAFAAQTTALAVFALVGRLPVER